MSAYDTAKYKKGFSLTELLIVITCFVDNGYPSRIQIMSPEH